jgi:hypothetical protein
VNERDPRRLDPDYLVFLRGRPCCLCGAPAEAAHIRIGLTGMGRRPHDRLAVPLCPREHRLAKDAQHSMSEAKFWNIHRIDPFELAAKYYAEYGGTGGKPKGSRKIRPRKPRDQRAKVTSSPDKRWPRRALQGRSSWPPRKKDQ